MKGRGLKTSPNRLCVEALALANEIRPWAFGGISAIAIAGFLGCSSGNLTEFPLPTTASRPVEITLGPDGNLWFTEGDGNNVGRITPEGNITEFPVRTAGSTPGNIT